MILSIWTYVHFMLGDITIRYIYDTQHLNIICIISYFDIFPIFCHYYYYNTYAIILIRLQRTAGPSCCQFFVICNTFAVCKTNKTATTHGCPLIISHTPPTIWANVVSSWSTYTKVIALHWYSYYCGLVYFIDIIFRTIKGDCLL